MGHIKMNCENISNTKKRHIYHFKPLFRVCHICHFDLLSLIYKKVWIGFEVLKSLYQKGVREYRYSEILVILYVVFVATELHFDTIFFWQYSLT